MGAGRNLEFLVWLRGPYRNLNIGRLCLPPIHQNQDRGLYRVRQVCAIPDKLG
jgi:hypothetical protein